MKALLISILMSALPAASVMAQSAPPVQRRADLLSPKTTEVMVILTPKQGVTRQQIVSMMPDEVRATMKLYLDGKIRQWYSRADGRGVVLLLDAKSVEEAHALVDAMPLAKENLVDHSFIALGPLMPLSGLIDGPAQ
jgi:hypothetical protein